MRQFILESWLSQMGRESDCPLAVHQGHQEGLYSVKCQLVNGWHFRFTIQSPGLKYDFLFLQNYPCVRLVLVCSHAYFQDACVCRLFFRNERLKEHTGIYMGHTQVWEMVKGEGDQLLSLDKGHRLAIHSSHK